MQHLKRIAALAAFGLFSLVASAGKTEDCYSLLQAQDYGRATQAGREAIRATPQSGDAHHCLGVSFMQAGDFDAALRNLQQAERLYTRKADLLAIYPLLGQVARNKGDLQQALNYHSRSLGLARELGKRLHEAAALNDVAVIFSRRGEQDKALDYYQQALRLQPEAERAATYNNIAVLHADKEDYKQAVEWFDKAIALSRRTGDYHGAARTMLNKGAVLTDQGAYEFAEKTLNEGLVAIRKVKDLFWEAVAQGYLGNLTKTREQYEPAKAAYLEALRLAKAAGATQMVEAMGRKLASLDKVRTAVSYAVIEIGSKGVKASVVTSSRDSKGRPNYEAGFRKSINTNIIQGVADTGEFTAEAIDETAKAVAELANAIRVASPNLGNHIIVVGSSALSGAMNRNELAEKVKEQTGFTPRFVTSAQEMTYALYGSINDTLAYKAALLDIGSGNGRLGYLISPRGDRPAGEAVIDLRAGSVSLAELANKARKPGEDYLPALNRVVDSDIAPKLTAELKQYPVIRRHKYFVLVGGAAWAMTTLLKPEDQDSYVTLSADDLRTYFDRLASNPDVLLNPDLNQIANTKVREKAAKQLEAVKKTFTVENLLAGARLLKAVAEANPFGKAEIVFARDGSWGYGVAEANALGQRASK
jgi:tetratricopeptide (TPR) repeat protein